MLISAVLLHPCALAVVEVAPCPCALAVQPLRHLLAKGQRPRADTEL